MLMAMGGATIEGWLKHLPRLWRGTIQAAYLVALTAWGIYVSTVILPLASSGPLRDRALNNNGDLREEIGWNELVKMVADIRDSLPAEQRQNVGVLVGNYGEQGAIEILGRTYQLAPTDQRDQLGLAARISRVTALSIDCCGAVTSIRRANAYLVPPSRP
jgi:hypothetical protein